MTNLPCEKAIGKACFEAFPEFAKRAIAYRLLHLLIPPEIARLLPKQLADPLIAPGVKVPLDAKFPPGTCVVPGCDFPAGWDPKSEPPACTKSAPLPPIAMVAGGANPNTMVAPGPSGPLPPSPPPPAPGIEPGSDTYYPAVSADDGLWYSGSFVNDGDYLMFGNYTTTSMRSFINFIGPAVPAGATIVSAILTLISMYTEGSGNIDITVRGVDIDNAVNPTSEAEADALTPTDANIVWDVANWTVNIAYAAPDLKTIIQEIVDRPGWEAGNNIMITLKGGIGSYNVRRPDAIDHEGGSSRAELYVSWK